MKAVAATCTWTFRALAALYCAALVAACQADPGYKGRTSSEWIAQLHDGSPPAREDAAMALGRVLAINPRLKPPITALVSALADTSDGVRVAASLALSQPGVSTVDALPGLAHMLEDSAHAAVRVRGVRALGRLLSSSNVTERARVLATVLPAYRDTDADVREAVAGALGQARSVDTLAAELQRALTALVTDPSSRTRARAVEALGATSSPVRREALRVALRDSSAAVRLAAITGLTRDTIALVALQTEILQVMTDPSARVRLAAVGAFSAHPTATDQATTAALRARLTDPDSAVRTEAAHALTQFHARGGRDPRSAEPSQLERCKQLPPRSRGC